jgi:16S rRNA (guanine527-N7)-methyltransferase
VAALSTIAGLAAEFGLDATQAEALGRYVDLMLAWPGNVTGLRRREQIVSTLLGDALALLDVAELVERAPAGWLDLGAGAGVPGIPLAVAVPTAAITLLDAAARKCAFLEAAVAAAGLETRASVVCARSERYASVGAQGREGFTVVLARALAPLPSLVELAAPLLAAGGVLLASKTRRALAFEGAQGRDAATQCGLAPGAVVSLPRSPLADAVCVIFEKVAPTPPGVPRRVGLAVRRPLAS